MALSEKDKAVLTDLCARNGIDEVVYELAQPTWGSKASKFNRACMIAFRVMQEPEGVKVQVVKDL